MRVLIVHDHLCPTGGGPAVAAWALQALCSRCDVSLLTWNIPDLRAVNEFYGTVLEPRDFRLHTAPRAARNVLRISPLRLARMSKALLLRECQRLDEIAPYDVLLHLADEGALHRRGIQYIHYPYEHLRISAGETLGLWERLNRKIATALWPLGYDAEQRNLTLTNSEFTAQAIRESMGILPCVVHPPVAASDFGLAWEDRVDGVVWTGRFLQSKHPFAAVEIVRRLRTLGHALTLHMVGIPAERNTLPALQAMARAESEWLQVHVALPREDLQRLLGSQRFGLHTMPHEHFGISVAESLRAGCVPFVPDSGGPAEIVGGDVDLLFASTEEAVAKIDALLRSEDRLQKVRTRLGQRRSLYTEETFMEAIRRIVFEFASTEPTIHNAAHETLRGRRC